MSGWAEHFLEALSPPRRRAAQEVSGLEQLLAALLRRAARERPGIHVPAEAFLAFIAERVSASRRPVSALLSSLAAGDLLLACALLRGDAAAAAVFERELRPELAALTAQLTRSSAAADDATQRIFVRLFLGEGDQPPRIRLYEGAGPLRLWARVATSRLAVDLMRHELPARPLEHTLLDGLEDLAPDPELAYLKSRSEGAVRGALETALRQLTSRERNLLRFHLSGLTAEQIGAMTGVHRVTIARTLSALRRRLLDQTRRELAEKLSLSSEEVDSLVRLATSKLSVSIERLLATEEGPEL